MSDDGRARRIGETLAATGLGSIMIALGTAFFCGYMIEVFVPAYGLVGFIVADLLALGYVYYRLLFAQRRPAGDPFRILTVRLAWALGILLAYGILLGFLLDPLEANRGTAVSVSLMFSGFVLLGLWMDGIFIALGLLATVLTIAAWLWLGSSFYLAMAFIEGGFLILIGLQMRRMESRPR